MAGGNSFLSLTASNPLPVRLARNIAERRRALRLTQAQLAEKLEIETETLSRFERGKHLPSLLTLEKLARLLQVTMADLLAEVPKQTDNDALAAAAWLSDLRPEDRDFTKGMLQKWCDHLAGRGDETA